MIKGFLRPRLARLGKIRLGKKAISAKTKNEYPADLPHFRVPEEVAAVYGEEPSELDVMVPSSDFDEFCPTELQRWGADERKICHSKDGETALCWSDEIGGWEEIPCAYKECPHFGKAKGQGCDERGNLYVILPRVSLGGVYQIDTGSRTGLTNILSEFTTFQTILGNLTGNSDMIRAVVFRLTREKETLHYLDGKVRKPVEKYVLHLRAPNLSMERAQQLAAQYRGNQTPLLSSGEAMALPAMASDDDRVLPQLPAPAELPPPSEECPQDLVPGASPVGPDLARKNDFAGLKQSLRNICRDHLEFDSSMEATLKQRWASFEATVARSVNSEASKFDDLAGETEAVEALKLAGEMVAKWQAELAEAIEAQKAAVAAPDPEAEPEAEAPTPHDDPTAPQAATRTRSNGKSTGGVRNLGI